MWQNIHYQICLDLLSVPKSSSFKRKWSNFSQRFILFWPCFKVGHTFGVIGHSVRVILPAVTTLLPFGIVVAASSVALSLTSLTIITERTYTYICTLHILQSSSVRAPKHTHYSHACWIFHWCICVSLW